MDSFELAESVRYSEDTKLPSADLNFDYSKEYESHLAMNSLKVSKEITPEVYNSLLETCFSLKLDIDSVKAYITSSSEIQASCVSFSKESCIITLTSKIINLLNFEEIKFVIGHELGHFLLGHNLETSSQIINLESYIKKRAQEISVDRIGLLACKDLNVATKTIIKCLSGLDENYLKFDLKAFIGQLEERSSQKINYEQFSTHPSFILRTKSLLRFSLSDPYQKIINSTSGTNIREIDQMIKKDLSLYVDKELRKNIETIKQSVSFWGFAYAFSKKGNFLLEDQQFLNENFGEVKSKKLIEMVRGIKDKEKIIETLKNKFITSVMNFFDKAPNLANERILEILNKIESKTNEKELIKELVEVLPEVK